MADPVEEFTDHVVEFEKEWELHGVSATWPTDINGPLTMSSGHGAPEPRQIMRRVSSDPIRRTHCISPLAILLPLQDFAWGSVLLAVGPKIWLME